MDVSCSSSCVALWNSLSATETETTPSASTLRLGFVHLDAGGRERVEVGVDRGELLAHVRGFGHQRFDDPFVGHRRELAVEAPAPLGHQVHQTAAAFAQGLGAGEDVGDVVVARNRERVLGLEHLRVERTQLHAHVLFALREIAARVDPLALAAAELLDLASGEMEPDRVDLGDEPVVAASRVGLAFERPQLPADLAQQIGEAQEVAFGRLEPAFGLLLALAELQDPGRFLDDRPAVLGSRVEHRVELALADDDVLLAADAGVGEEVLDVEQPARDAVDEVLRLTGPEEHPGDRHLGELDRQQPRGVVDRERDLGPPERRPIGGAGEDDVVHLGAAQRPGALGAEHPRDRIHDVRLARPVGADDDTHPGFELERGLVREGLEALQRQRLEEQEGPLSGGRW